MPHHALRLVAILHTHWDREWYLPRAAFLPRLVALVDSALDLLERDPRVECFHLDGQTVVIEDYLTVRPEARERVSRLVAAGRLAVGPWYVLADELLSSGEALVRNLALGTHTSRALGQRLDVGYSPDAFGHPAALPTLLQGFGIETAVLWRGVRDNVPGDRFRWVAPDGAAVHVLRLPPRGYETPLPVELAPLAPRAAGSVLPLFVGADHHAPEPDVADRLEGIPIGRLDEALRSLEHDDLLTVAGELRSPGSQWVLQGTHSARIPLKLAIWHAGRWLERWAEPLAAIAGLPLARTLVGYAWRVHLQNHFHDTLCGSVADDVAREALARAREVEAAAREVVRNSLDTLLGHDPVAARRAPRQAWRPALVLWNPAPRERSGVVIADVTRFVRDLDLGTVAARERTAGTGARGGTDQPVREGLALQDEGGMLHPVQVLDRRRAVERLESPRDYPDQDEVEVLRVAFGAPPVKGLGLRVLRLVEREVALPGSSLRVSPRRLENSHVAVEIARDGTGTLTDKEGGERYPGLIALEDCPDEGDLYSFCPPRGAVGQRVSEPGVARVVCQGPLVGAVETRVGEFALTWVLHHDSPIVRLALRHTHRGRDHRLRVLAPTGLRGVEAVAGAQFGPVRRPALRADEPSSSGEWPVMTAPCQRVVSAAAGRRGLSVFTGGLAEYQLMEDGTLAITLLRAVGELSKRDLWTRPGDAGWAVSTPEAQGAGPRVWHLGLLPHSADALARYSTIADGADDFDTPLAGRMIRNALDLSPTGWGVVLEGDGLVFSSCHPSEFEPGAIVLRCYNATGRPVRGAWRFSGPVAAAYRVRLDEEHPWPLDPADGGRVVAFEAAAREVVTVRVVRS